MSESVVFVTTRNMWPPFLSSPDAARLPAGSAPTFPKLGQEKAYNKARRPSWEKLKCFPRSQDKSAVRDRLSKLRARPLVAIRDVMVSYFFMRLKVINPVSWLNSSTGDYMFPILIPPPPQVWLSGVISNQYLLNILHAFYRKVKSAILGKTLLRGIWSQRDFHISI